VKFSICIPNFNYAQYLGDTIRSVLEQDHDDLEVVVADNASTDDSVDVLRAIDDPRLRFEVNERNVGFAANLDRVVGMAEGDWVILLSSDDLMLPGALRTYARLIDALGADAKGAVLNSGQSEIDADGATVSHWGPYKWLWSDEHRSAALESATGDPVLTQPSDLALAVSLRLLRNPLYFATVAYPIELYRLAGGYGGRPLINPDKGFHLRLLAAASGLYYVDRSLFAYRIHASNQMAQQRTSGALKHLVDQYVYTFDIDDEVLRAGGVDRQRLASAFVEHDVALRGLRSWAFGDAQSARRTLRFGQAAYPDLVRRNWKVWALRTALLSGRPGQWVAQRLEQRVRERLTWPDQRAPLGDGDTGLGAAKWP
jgi:glycosyltransferase involved in cell wall biosynthesis